MAVEIKFCGMTRAADVREGVALGAAFVGVIFAGGPRSLTGARAAEVLASANGARRVGVFGASPAAEISRIASELGLDVVQLHDVADPRTIDAVRGAFDGEVWPVLRLAGELIPPQAKPFFDVSQAVVLDAALPGTLGGTGVTLPWPALADEVSRLRDGRGAKLILAGGLRPENVGEAIRVLRPDVVDVSSGVESAPGIKDHARMRAFRDAVRESTR